MSLTITASGTQAATVNTEHTLTTLTGAKTFTLHVDTNAMSHGSGTADELELRIKANVLSAGTERVVYLATFTGAQDVPIKISLPVPVTQTATVTLKQTAGTGRSYPWSVTTPD
ncbi:hypothetical protein ACLQ2R_17360 [Streptosporangium sp. DT93]|uniref:hypothetical protein n=1 Tax=Streptosporangium sp. DT93 TaxID=3393428 RepID=UPI003CE86790